MSTAFRIVLDSAQEIGTGSTSAATGLGTAVFDSAATTLSYFLTIAGLDFGELLNGGVPDTADPNDDVTLMHIHNGNRGANGPVAFDILPLGSTDDADDLTHSQNPNGSRNISGLWETTDPASTSLNTFAAALGAALPGNDAALYFNIHSAQFGGGVIRGQFVCIADDNANTVNGTNGDDRLPGLGGADTVNGGLGNDLLQGGDGDDTLNGGDGDDTLDGGAGTDTMAGGQGGDTYIVDSQSETLTEALNQGIDAVNTALANYSLFAIANVERILFTGVGNFVGRGNALDNRLEGGLGNDRFVVDQGGADRYFGETGVADTVDYRLSATGAIVNLTTGVHAGAAAGDFFSSIEYFFGSNTAADDFTGAGFNDRLDGYGGADVLRGLGGNDTIMGGDGDDEVSGGALLDFLYGNAGADDFNYADVSDSGPTSGARDRVFDFVAGSDDIDVSAIDADTSTGADDAFTAFIGAAAFTAAGQIRAFQSGANTVIEFNTTGTGGAEMQIQLNAFTAATLTAGDFIA